MVQGGPWWDSNGFNAKQKWIGLEKVPLFCGNIKENGMGSNADEFEVKEAAR